MSVFDDPIQRALNEAKKEELRQKYGAAFSAGDPELPPDIESKWLSSIEEFEQKFESAETTTVRRFIGSPAFRPLGEITPEELEKELGELLELLEANDILVHFGREVSPAETYRFITEELMDVEMEDVRIEGMTHNYVYEEFHPDDVEEASSAARDLLFGLLHRDMTIIWHLLSKDETYDPFGIPLEPGELEKRFREFIDRTEAFTRASVDLLDCTVDNDRAVVRLRTSWTAIATNSMELVPIAGESVIRLKKGSSAEWGVVQANIPGLQ